MNISGERSLFRMFFSHVLMEALLPSNLLQAALAGGVSLVEGLVVSPTCGWSLLTTHRRVLMAVVQDKACICEITNSHGSVSVSCMRCRTCICRGWQGGIVILIFKHDEPGRVWLDLAQ